MAGQGRRPGAGDRRAGRSALSYRAVDRPERVEGVQTGRGLSQAGGSQRPSGTGRRHAVLPHGDTVVFAFRLAKRVISLRGEIN